MPGIPAGPSRQPDGGGPLFANLSGSLLGLLMGLTGVMVDDGDPADWHGRPVILPTGWTVIEVERIWIRGRPARLGAEHGADRAAISFQRN